MCPACELILNEEAVSGQYEVKEPTLVRALMGEAQSAGTAAPDERPSYPASERETTAKGAAPMDAHTFPVVTVGLDVALAPLHPFEAYVVSFVTGTQPVPEIAQGAKLKQVEVEAVLRSLVERQVVALELRLPAELADQPPAPSPAAEPRPLPVEFVQPIPKRAPTVDLPREAAEARGPRAASPAGPAGAKLGSLPVPPVLTPSAPSPAKATGTTPSAVPPQKPLESKRLYQPSPGFSPSRATRTPSLQVLPDRGVSTTPPERPEAVLQKAIALERAGDVGAAVELLERAIARFKKPAPLYNKLAIIILNQFRDHDRAEELLKKAVELEPDNAVYQQNLLKVVTLAASRTRKKNVGLGFFARLLRKK